MDGLDAVLPLELPTRGQPGQTGRQHALPALPHSCPPCGPSTGLEQPLAGPEQPRGACLARLLQQVSWGYNLPGLGS